MSVRNWYGQSHDDPRKTDEGLRVGVCAYCGDDVFDSDDMVYDVETDEWYCNAECYLNKQKKRGAILEGERWPPE